MFSKIKVIIISVVLLIHSGCSTVHKGIRNRNLEVQTKMSETIFLDPVSNNKKSIFVEVRNISDKKDMEIACDITSKLQEKGYKIVNDPNKATFILQANILQVGKNNMQDPFRMLMGGYGGALEGLYAGAIIGGVSSKSWEQGAAIGGLLGAVVGTIIDAAIEVVNYSIVTDLQISQKSNNVITEANNTKLKQGTGIKNSTWNEKTGWKKYQTRIISSAKKTNLKFETAIPSLKEGLVQSISGMF